MFILMSIKNRAHTTYRNVKYSEKWQTNKFFAFIHPLFNILSKTLVIIYQKLYLPIKRSKPGRSFRVFIAKTKKKISQLSLTTLLFDTARLAVLLGRWKVAYYFFQKGLDRELGRGKKRGSGAKRQPRPEYINEARLNISVIQRIIDIEGYKKQISSYGSKKKKPKIAIYTAIAADYDTIKLPEVLLPNVDYFLFTDMKVPDTEVYNVRPLPYFHVDTPRMTRYIKTHPHNLLKGYEIAIWIDANILITGDISPVINNFIASKKPVGAIQHPLRNTIKQEVDACISYNKDDNRSLLEQFEHYKKLDYETNDLIESNIMMFDLKNGGLSDFFATWWSEIDKYTRRDQLSLNYSLDKNKISWHKIMSRPEDARNHPLFTLVPHSVKQRSVKNLNELLCSKMIDPYKGSGFQKNKQRVITNQKDRKIDIVYCAHNAPEDVQLCLASVAKHNNNPNMRLIIVDDGSDAPTADFLQSFQKKHNKWVKLIRNSKAKGYTKAANMGMRASSGDLVIILNSDTIVTENWAEKMADAVFSTPGGGIVGPLSSAASHQSIPNHIGTDKQTATNHMPAKLNADIINEFCEKWSVYGYYPYVPLIHGFCIGITKEVLNKIGYFDEESFPTGYGEENDFCFRAADAGFTLLVTTNTYIYHAKSKSFSNDDRRIKLMKDGNSKLQSLRGKERIERSVRSVLKNPYLQTFRDNAKDLYRKYS